MAAVAKPSMADVVPAMLLTQPDAVGEPQPAALAPWKSYGSLSTLSSGRSLIDKLASEAGKPLTELWSLGSAGGSGVGSGSNPPIPCALSRLESLKALAMRACRRRTDEHSVGALKIASINGGLDASLSLDKLPDQKPVQPWGHPASGNEGLHRAGAPHEAADPPVPTPAPSLNAMRSNDAEGSELAAASSLPGEEGANADGGAERASDGTFPPYSGPPAKDGAAPAPAAPRARASPTTGDRGGDGHKQACSDAAGAAVLKRAAVAQAAACEAAAVARALQARPSAEMLQVRAAFVPVFNMHPQVRSQWEEASKRIAEPYEEADRLLAIALCDTACLETRRIAEQRRDGPPPNIKSESAKAGWEAEMERLEGVARCRWHVTARQLKYTPREVGKSPYA